MLTALTLPLVVFLLAFPRIPGLPKSWSDLKKLRQGSAPLLDSLPPAWKPASRLALENQFVQAALPRLTPGPVGLKLAGDPRRIRIGMDPDSGTVRYATEFGSVEVGEAKRMPLSQFTRDLTLHNFSRLWAERVRAGMIGFSATGTEPAPRTGLSFELPNPLPRQVKGLLGPGGPSLRVSGSENIRLSGQSEWTNQQTGLLGRQRSLFPSLDMQQDLDIKLEGRLSDRVGVNLLQNSANQIPLANRIAINYKGDEDDLVQSLDLGNTNLTLPGTQYVSYSGKNEGLFGMKATTRLGPLDVTVLASKQEGRSERSSYAGGSTSQKQTLYDREYVPGVYFFLYDPNLDVRSIDETSINLYLDAGTYTNPINTVRGRAFLDPNSACLDTLACPDGPDADTAPDTTSSIRGTFRLLKAGADQDYEILSDVYGPQFLIIRLHSGLRGENQKLAATYRYREVIDGVTVGDSIVVGGQSLIDTDGEPAVTMKLIRAPLDVLPADDSGNFDTTLPFAPTRELELRNFYQLQGQRIDPKTFEIAVRKGNDVPPVTTVRPGVPYIEVLGLDNFDESQGFVDFTKHGHDGRVDGTAPSSNFRAFVDFENGTLFFLDPRPFAPRLRPDSTGRPFERFISSLLFRSDSLVGAPGEPNEANPAIYDKRIVQGNDWEYSMEVHFTAARASNEIALGRTNIIENSDVVTINGQRLDRDRDYRIDYDLGRVTLIRQLGPADQLNIDYSYAPLFQQAGRTLIGNSFRYEGRDRSFGGAFIYESKGAQDLRPRIGEEPSRVLIGDLNTDWRFKPEWMTRWVDRLPGVRTTAPSEFSLSAETGASFPNPNTRNEVFIDDMEGVRDAISLSMGPERWRWSSIPLRSQGQTVEDSTLFGFQKNTEVHWYSPLNVIKERDLKPSLTNAQGAQNARQTLAISLPRRPTSVSDPAQPLWAGLTYPIDPIGLDLSRAQFIDLWVNDFRDFHDPLVRLDRVRGRRVKLHVDLGVMAEDQRRAPNVRPNGLLDSEDRRPRDNQLTVTDENNEDTGFDNQLDPTEAPAVPPDLVTADPGRDPEGDDFALPNRDFKDFDPRKWRFTNGTEDNKNVLPVPDTEDLNLNNALDTQQSYYEYTIDLGDTAHRYLVTDIFQSFETYANDGARLPEDNGWRRFRIPIDDSLRVRFGVPDLTLARHVRVWLEDVIETDPPPLTADDGRPFVMIGGLEIVGSRWFATDLDSTSARAGTTVTLNSINTIDNADVYVAPFDPGRTRSGSQELTRREQSLALEFTRLQTGDTLEAYKTFSLDENYSRYGRLNWYAAGFDIPGYDATADSLDYFVRFASDEKGINYYEYRTRVPRSSVAGGIAWQDAAVVLTDLSNLKLNLDFPKTAQILYRAPGRNPYEEYVIKGRPSFTRVRRISFGIINVSGKEFPSGQVWLNEVRATDVAKDAGRAQRLNINGRMSNLLSYNLAWNGRDADFQSVGESRGSGNQNSSLTFGSTFDLHRFFEGTGINLPVNVNFQSNRSSPRFTAGDDVIRTGALAEASETRSSSRSVATSYSRSWGERAHPFLRYTVGGVTANLSHSWSQNRTPISVDSSKALSAGVGYGIAPRRLLALPVPGTRVKFYPLPERFFWNYSIQTSEARNFDRLRDSTGALVLSRLNKTRNAGIDFGADTRPFDLFRHQFQAYRNLTLPEPLREQFGIVNLGRVVRWRQSMDTRMQPQKLGPWLRPNLSWNSNYNQSNGLDLSPDLSMRGVSNAQAMTVNWNLPFDRLDDAVATPRDTLRKGLPPWRRLLARLGSMTTDFSLTKGSTHSRITGTPNFLYLLGLSSDPGLEPDSTGRVRQQFGNRSDQNLQWSSSARTVINVGLGATLTTRADVSSVRSSSNGVTNRSNRFRFPELDVEYGKVAETIGLKRFMTNPRLKTAYHRSQSVEFANSRKATGVSTTSEWRPLLEMSGDLKNGTRTELRVERRVTEIEDRRLGRSVTSDANTDINFSLTRSYSKGQKVNVLGKETTVRSSISLGMTSYYRRRNAKTVQEGFELPQNQVENDQLAISGKGGYNFSTNVNGNLELGFLQIRNLQTAITTRSIRVELRAQFTF